MSDSAASAPLLSSSPTPPVVGLAPDPVAASFAGRSDEQLGEEIATWAGRIAAGEARLIGLIGEFDRREAWGQPGMLSCAHWLSWRLGMGRAAAHERVRVARALRGLPAIAAAFTAGRVSWTQVRAITRVAVAADEDTYLDCARHCTGAQLETLTRGVRRARRAEEDCADPEQAAWRMRARTCYDPDGTLMLTVRMPAEQGAIVLAAIEEAMAELDRQRGPRIAPDQRDARDAQDAQDAQGGEGGEVRAASGSPETASGYPGQSSAEDCTLPAPATASHLGGEPVDRDAPGGGRPDRAPAPSADRAASPAGTSAADDSTSGGESSAEDSSPSAESLPLRATMAEGLLRIAQDSLDQRRQERPAAVRRGRARLVAQVDPLSGWARLPDGELLPRSSLSAQARSLPGSGRLRALAAGDLTAQDLGRSQRTPSLALRELLGTLDGHRCRFPGCTRRRRLDAHHVQPWAAGGRTDLANLVLLCARHHQAVVHSKGFRLELHHNRRLEVHTASGEPVLHRPPLPWQPAHQLPDQHIGPDTLPPTTHGDTLDLHYAVSVLCQQAA